MSKKKTTDKFIIDAIKIHGNKYDYSLVIYVNNYTNVKIICPIHGVFEQNAFSHLKGCICPSCSGNKKLTKKEFVEKSNDIHQNNYDYSLVIYVNNSTKVDIICKKCDKIFEQRPYAHLNKHGCPYCTRRFKLDNVEFIKSAIKVHGNKYDYSLVVYINSATKVKIICPIHGIFEQLPNNHLSQKQGCPLCGGGIKSNKEEFIEKSNKIHGSYDYSLVKYINNNTKVDIICIEHGIFKQTPHNHLNNQGCPKCGIRNRRLKNIQNIEYNKLNGFQLIPGFNKKACKIFDDISLTEGIQIQHAMNGGEYYIKELGYWVDGYDPINNVVYEFDERHHKYQKEKDLIRQKEIEFYLKCKFIRINE